MLTGIDFVWAFLQGVFWDWGYVELGDGYWDIHDLELVEWI